MDIKNDIFSQEPSRTTKPIKMSTTRTFKYCFLYFILVFMTVSQMFTKKTNTNKLYLKNSKFNTQQ